MAEKRDAPSGGAADATLALRYADGDYWAAVPLARVRRPAGGADAQPQE